MLLSEPPRQPASQRKPPPRLTLTSKTCGRREPSPPAPGVALFCYGAHRSVRRMQEQFHFARLLSFLLRFTRASLSCRKPHTHFPVPLANPGWFTSAHATSPLSRNRSNLRRFTASRAVSTIKAAAPRAQPSRASR